MQKFIEFQQAYDKAVAEINEFLKPGPETPTMAGLVQWMLSTDANPYSYLPENWAFALESAQGFASLLRNIHHALYDDGDIEFVTVNGQPRIVFASRHDDDFRDRVLTELEQSIEARSHYPYRISVLVISPSDFGPLYDAWQVADIKRCFLGDASGCDPDEVEEVAMHYRRYRYWNEAWVREALTG